MSNAFQVRTVQAGQTSFLLREHVAGPSGSTPVLLLHGVPETASCWTGVASQLAAGRRVLVPDLPGLGGSSYPGPYDVPSLVAQLAALVEGEVPGGRVDVVGHDWGGSLALGLAGGRPDLVRRIVVANAPFREVPLLRAPHVPFFALPIVPELLFRLGGRRVVDTMFALAWRSPQPLDDERRAEYAAAYTDPVKVRAMLGYYRAAARPRLAALARRETLAGPPRVAAEKALVLWGAADPVFPIRVGEGVVRDLGADCVMVTVPGAGHFVVEEAPEAVTRVLLDFLADESTPPAVPAEPPTKAVDEKTLIEPPAGGREPAKKAPVKKASPAKKAPVKKASPAKKAPAQRAIATKASATKAPTPKATPGQAAAAKVPAKKAGAAKSSAAGAPARRVAVRPAPKSSSVRKSAAVKKISAQPSPATAPAEQVPARKAPGRKAPVRRPRPQDPADSSGGAPQG